MAFPHMQFAESSCATSIEAVMVVEDHVLIREALMALLKTQYKHWKVDGVATMTAARDLLELRDYDTVFVDLDLGSGESGLHLIKHIRESGRAVMAIAISASDDPATIRQSIESGAVGFISKRFTRTEELESAVRDIAAGHTYLPDHFLNANDGSPTDQPDAKAEIYLAPRLRQALLLLCMGMRNKEIALSMGISEITVRNSYLRDLFRLFNVTSRTELVVEVARRKIALRP